MPSAAEQVQQLPASLCVALWNNTIADSIFLLFSQMHCLLYNNKQHDQYIRQCNLQYNKSDVLSVALSGALIVLLVVVSQRVSYTFCHLIHLCYSCVSVTISQEEKDDKAPPEQFKSPSVPALSLTGAKAAEDEDTDREIEYKFLQNNMVGDITRAKPKRKNTMTLDWTDEPICEESEPDAPFKKSVAFSDELPRSRTSSVVVAGAETGLVTARLQAEAANGNHWLVSSAPTEGLITACKPC